MTLHLDNGTEIQGYLAEPTGMPGNPISDAALHQKYFACLEYAGVPDEQAAALLENLLELETSAPLSRCFEPLGNMP